MRSTFYKVAFAGIFFSILFTAQLSAQCEDWVDPSPTTGWTDFNTAFGGAPCDDGNGCPFNEIQDFQVWKSEAYSIENFIEGGEYTFSMCNGPGAGSWTPEFTIIAPSGAIDAFGAGDGDGCSITWTASETGTYLIVINEADNCGVAEAVDNGFPAITCMSGTPCDTTVVVCSPGELATTGEVSICEEDGTFTIETDGSEGIVTGGGYGWSFDNTAGGTGGPNGGFTLSGSDPSSTYDAGLNGILADNMLPDLEGGWVIFGFAYTNAADPTGSICGQTTDSLTVYFGTESPTIDDITDNGDNSATVTASGGAEPYEYLWDDGQTTATATDLSDGVHTVTVTDANGCTATAEINIVGVAVNEITSLQDFIVSPNPTSDNLNVSLKFNKSVDLMINVFDITGKVQLNVEERNISTVNRTLDFSELPQGVYMVQIMVGNEQFTKRVVKE